jgi:hypothetical protein
MLPAQQRASETARLVGGFDGDRVASTGAMFVIEDLALIEFDATHSRYGVGANSR